MWCLEKTKHHSASKGRLVNLTKKFPSIRVMKLPQFCFSSICWYLKLKLRSTKTSKMSFSEVRSPLLRQTQWMPASKISPTLTTLSSEKILPDFNNNTCVYKACSSITVLSCHSSSRGGVGAAKGKRPERSFPKKRRKEKRKRRGKVKQKRERGGNWMKNNRLQHFFRVLEERLFGSVPAWAGQSRIVLRPDRWGSEKDRGKDKRQRQRHHAEATVNGRAGPGGETRACHRSLGPWLRGGPLEGALCKAHTQEWTVYWVYIRK